MGENEYGIDSNDMDPLLLEQMRARDAARARKIGRRIYWLLMLIILFLFPAIFATVVGIVGGSWDMFRGAYLMFWGICFMGIMGHVCFAPSR